ncbi:MAG: tRNA-(ms[2]io[6]A)-hydroxylase [Gammaproteobacteria bacterium]|nr:tRNA-(ms[2]io[6]A)-hydroxylase [Gammaproteobacteria bacterium]
MDFTLRETSSVAWLETVMADFDSFLKDHASCEKKASGMAMSMISHYPDKPELITGMLNLAVEELSHFRDVMRLILDRDLEPAADARDEYVNSLHKAMDQGKDAYLLDRLLIASIVEARGAERFAMIAEALQKGKLKNFYSAISDSEARHYQLFLSLAEQYFPEEKISTRLEALLNIEADIIRSLPLKPALH